MKKIVFAFLLISLLDVSFAQSVPACTDLSTNLVRGAESKDVLSLQNFLSVKGFLKTEPNGYFGPVTFSALKAYQKSVGLSPVGNTGPATRSAMKKESCGKTTVSTSFSRVASSTSSAPHTASSTVSSTPPVVVISQPIISSITKGTLFTGGITVGTTSWRVTLNGFFPKASTTISLKLRGNNKKFEIGTFQPTSSTTLLLPTTLASSRYSCGTGCYEILPVGEYEVTAKNQGGESDPIFLAIQGFTISSLSSTLSSPLKQKATSTLLGTVSFASSRAFFITDIHASATPQGLSKGAVTNLTLKDAATGKAPAKFGSSFFVGENESKIIGIYGNITSTSSGFINVEVSVTAIDFVGKLPSTFTAPQFLTTVSGF